MMNDNQEKNFAVEEPTSLKSLQEYGRQGFVFHGSANGNITILEPRPAADIIKIIHLIMIQQFLQLSHQ